MFNKVIIGILVFLVVLTAGIGTYSYMLNQQVNDLNEQLISSQEEQATRIAAVTDDLTAFKGETSNTIDRLREGIDENIAEIDIVGEEIDSLGEEIDESISRISFVRGEVQDVSTELSQSASNAIKIYEEVSQAIVRITDGERMIGSGFILGEKNHVVTAHHVVEDLTKIVVILADGSISTATITGSCKSSDIALLTLEDEAAAKPLSFADSGTLSVGQPVVTIGNPFDLPETLTSGVISKLNGFIEIEHNSQNRWVANIIQFDAPVNSGNSGCPLLNSQGQVIGMVIARVKPSYGDGIYYAVSSNKLKRVIDAIIDQGTFDYPLLGVEVSDLTPEVVQNRGLDTMNGVLVDKVTAGGPAKTAGIEADDIIIAIDGKEIRDVADLTSYLGEHKSPDEEVTITLIRDKTQLELSLTIGKRRS